jgi:hypothetical protein
VWAEGASHTHVSGDKMPSRKNWVRVAEECAYIMRSDDIQLGSQLDTVTVCQQVKKYGFCKIIGPLISFTSF